MTGDQDDVAITISGDMSGQVVAGDHNIVISAASGSTVTVLKPGERPRPVRREHIALLPRRGAAPIGRAAELATLLELTEPGGQVQVYGEPGIGKTTVLRRLAHELAERGDPVVFLNGGGWDADDLLQAVFESCFDSAGYRPSAIELRRLLTGVRISLVIDDLEAPEEILEAVPDACLVWSSVRRSPLLDGHSAQLLGLAKSDGMALVERQLNRPLDTAEIASAEALWAFANGRPTSIIQALAATSGAAALPDSEHGLLTALLPQLDLVARQALGLLDAVAPAAITPELLQVLLPRSESIDQLVRCGLVAADEDGLRISLGAGTEVPTELRASPDQLTDAISNLVTWLAAPTSTAAAGANGPAIARLIELAIDGGHAELACRLARAAAPLIGASLRWGSWRMILAQGSAAAKKIHDSRALAYFTHEDGIRSLGLGKQVAAGAAFGAAFALWQRLGDLAAATAAHNAQGLTTVPAAPWTPVPHVPTPPPPLTPTPAAGPDITAAVPRSPAPAHPPGAAPSSPGPAPTPPPGPAPPPPTPWQIPGGVQAAGAVAVKTSVPLIIKLVIVVVVVLAGGAGTFAIVAIVTDHVAQSPPATPTTGICNVTADQLDKAYPVGPAHYLDTNCYDKYILATANTEPKLTDDLKVTFEFTDGSWRWAGGSGTLLKCGTIPQVVWQHWNETCTQDPVSCDGSRLNIVIVSGPVDCATAGVIAERYYQLLSAGQVNGQGHFATVDDWECDWPYVDGIPHSDTYHECTRKADGAVIHIN